MHILTRHWKMHLIVLGLVAVAEWIYIQRIPLGPGVVLLLPLLYAFVFGVLANPNVIAAARHVISQENVKAASPIIVIAIMPFIAKFGTLVGPAMETLIAAGPALILQEIGNLFTIIIAMPVAVLLLRMKRESIGATYSIAREPNIAIISDRYGLTGPEGSGVMGVYVIGTMFGGIVFALMASFFGSTGWLHPHALAMACGVGSGGMMAACSGSLAEVVPDMRDQILAFAGASNLLTNATGLYVGIFIALPFAEWLYRKISGDTTPATKPITEEN